MNPQTGCFVSARDPVYQLAMLRICELRSDAMRGRDFRRTRRAGR